MRTHAIIIVAAALTLAACDDAATPGGPSTAGTLLVSTSTGGNDPDPDGYLLTVDGVDSLVLAATGNAEISLSAGQHTLQLLSVAGQCSVAPGTRLDVDVASQDTTSVAFKVTCSATGVRITTTTTGLNFDSDGYLVEVDSTEPVRLLSTGTVLIPLDPGNRTVVLTGLSPNCTIKGSASRPVTIVNKEVARIDFAVVCTATSGVIGVVISGSGVGGVYQAMVDGGTPFPVGPADRVYLEGVTAGDHVVSLSSPAGCLIDTDHQSVTVTAGTLIRDTIEVTFSVACSATRGVLAFTVDNTLALINPDGTDYRALTTPTSNQSDHHPAWSPDGDRIAFSRMSDGSAFPLAIHVISPDGINLVRLSPSGAFDDTPAWSPDGQRIAFTNQDTLLHTAAGVQIYLMNADGSHRVPLTSLPRGAFSPTWSPDGEKIAFVDRRTDGYLGNIYVMDKDGTHLSALTNDRARNFNPAWSPDGTRIVFSKGGALFVINADGTHGARLTSPPAAGWSYSDYEPAWSPDGHAVVFTRSYDCDPFNDNGGPPCVPTELRAIRSTGAAFVSSLITHGSGASWGP